MYYIEIDLSHPINESIKNNEHPFTDFNIVNKIMKTNIVLKYMDEAASADN